MAVVKTYRYQINVQCILKGVSQQMHILKIIPMPVFSRSLDSRRIELPSKSNKRLKLFLDFVKRHKLNNITVIGRNQPSLLTQWPSDAA